MSNKNQQISDKSDLGESTLEKPAADIKPFPEILEQIQIEDGVSTDLAHFFEALNQTDWIQCNTYIAQLYQHSANYVNSLCAQSKLQPAHIKGLWLFCVRDGHYVAVNQKTKEEIALTNFMADFHAGVWFSREKETWFEGTIKMDQTTCPFFVNSDSLYHIDDFIVECQSAIYADPVQSQMQQPVILRPEHAVGLLQLIRQQTQKFNVQHGVSYVGWERDRFLMPAWTGSAKGVFRSSGILYPNHEQLNTIFTTNDPRPVMPQSVPGTAGNVIAALVAFLYHGYHNWPCQCIDVQYATNAEQLLMAVFRTMGQIHIMKDDWKSVEDVVKNYPLLVGAGVNVPDRYPAFRLSGSGMLIPNIEYTPDELHTITIATASVLKRCLPYIIKQSAVPAAQAPKGFFEFVHIGKKIIDDCGPAIPIVLGEGQYVWQYFASIPADKLSKYARTDLKEQKLYLLFDGTTIRRKYLRDELLKEYPKTEPVMVDERHLQLSTVHGLELMHQFYGPHPPVGTWTKAENSVASEDSAPMNSAKPNT